MKKDVYKRWRWKERLDVDFDSDVVFCRGCKLPEGKPINLFQERCSARTRAVDKGKKNCVLCDEMVDCQKQLWDRFQEHKQYVIDMQEKHKQKIKVQTI